MRAGSIADARAGGDHAVIRHQASLKRLTASTSTAMLSPCERVPVDSSGRAECPRILPDAGHPLGLARGRQCASWSIPYGCATTRVSLGIAT